MNSPTRTVRWSPVTPLPLGEGGRYYEGANLHPPVLAQPLHWRNPRHVLVVPKFDLFAPGVPWRFVDEVMGAILMTPRHTYQLTTLHTSRLLAYFTHAPNRTAGGWTCYDWQHRVAAHVARAYPRDLHTAHFRDLKEWSPYMYPLPNLWLGARASTTAEADRRVCHLLGVRAVVRFLDLAPLHEEVDLYALPSLAPLGALMPRFAADDPRYHGPNGRGLDWVRVAGDSRRLASPTAPAWVRLVRDQCAGVGVPFTFGGWGRWAPTADVYRIHQQPGGGPIIPARLGLRYRTVGGETMWDLGRGAGRILDGQTYDAPPTPVIPSEKEVHQI